MLNVFILRTFKQLKILLLLISNCLIFIHITHYVKINKTCLLYRNRNQSSKFHITYSQNYKIITNCKVTLTNRFRQKWKSITFKVFVSFKFQPILLPYLLQIWKLTLDFSNSLCISSWSIVRSDLILSHFKMYTVRQIVY